MADLTQGAEVRRMWPGGPLRLFRENRIQNNSGWIRYSSDFAKLDGYVGPYVCSECMEPCLGVYRLVRRDNRNGGGIVGVLWMPRRS